MLNALRLCREAAKVVLEIVRVIAAIRALIGA